MDSNQNLDKSRIKQLMKILIGAAWLDGVIQPSERDYLRRMAKDNALADDRDIILLLSEIKPVKPAECYEWLKNYLGENPTEDDYLKLLESLSGLIYSDGEVQTQEALLLDKLQLLDPAAKDTSKNSFDRVLQAVQKLYRKAVSQKA